MFDAVPEFFSRFSPTYGQMTYVPRPGTYSTLEHLDVSEFVVMGGELYDINGTYQETYNPDRYQLTLLDGTSYTIDENEAMRNASWKLGQKSPALLRNILSGRSKVSYTEVIGPCPRPEIPALL